MKVVKYSLHLSDKDSDDAERAVLPTIIYAHRKDGIASVTIIAIGWWAWGIGIIRTVVELPK